MSLNIFLSGYSPDYAPITDKMERSPRLQWRQMLFLLAL